jgi:hypothetical protein
MFLRHSSRDARRGVILIVVLALLTLFAIVGLSFVLYAQAEAESSRLYKEDKNLRQALESPDRMWGWALSKVLYDEYDDATGVYSGLRGHSLGRSEYGLDTTLDPNGNVIYPIPNQTAFNGTGRLTAATPIAGLDEKSAVNYTWFQSAGDPLHDPERMNAPAWRANLGSPPGLITGGINVPYTYPDLNNMFLAAINANGQVLARSFHRDWLFNPGTTINDQTNPNWTNPQGKYLTLRPRPADHSAAFPYPEDAGGDVKNLYWLPGPNDSIWVDLGYPVQVAPDGRKYKPLFAFFITDLDNRINLNVHGNIRGATDANGFPTHAGNTGWVKTEVNLSQVLIPGVPSANMNAPPTVSGEWTQIFTGVPATAPGSFNMVTIRGRWGWPDPGDNSPNGFGVPENPLNFGSGGNLAGSGDPSHVYGQVDYDGCQELNGFTPSVPIVLPNSMPPYAASPNPYSCFPFFLQGYGNGSNQEHANHPLLYDFFRPFSVPAVMPNGLNPTPIAPDNRPLADDRAFSAFEMKDLLNGGLVADASAGGPYGTAPIMASNAMKSQLGLLLPFNFNDPLDLAGSLRRRSLVTTLSMDVNRPGMSPWMWNADAPDPVSGLPVASLVQPRNPPITGENRVMSPPPWGNPSSFPNPTNSRGTSAAGSIPLNSEFNVPGANATTSPAAWLQSNWRAATQTVRQILGRIDLSRALTPYPISPTYRYDTAPAAIQNQFLQAQQDRQKLAAEIYGALRKLCGVASATTFANIAAPTDLEVQSRRWLAQLAVNIVDFIDADDISTPFQFYPDNEFQLLGLNPPPIVDPTTVDTSGPAATPNPELFRYWVFGTEMPRIVLNEVFTEYDVNTPPAAGPVTINVWAELFYTLPPPAAAPSYDPTDGANVLLSVPPTNATSNDQYAPYRIVIANTNRDVAGGFSQGGPLVPRPIAPPNLYSNDNVLGTPDQIRTQTLELPAPAPASALAFTGNAWYIVNDMTGINGNWNTQIPPATLSLGYNPIVAGAPAPTAYLIIGPGDNTNHGAVAPAPTAPNVPNSFTDKRMTLPNWLPTGTIALPSASMQYTVTQDALGNWTVPGTNPALPVQDKANGITVLLRRLANPHLPTSMVAGNATTGAPNPFFNPYITVDFLEGVPLNNYKDGTPGEISVGKVQPYAADPSQVQPQGTLAGGKTVHTLGKINTNGANPPAPYDWLVHLDRTLVSPMELLHVSGYHPHELTHRFVVPSDPDNYVYNNSAPVKFSHRVNWFDQTTRLYRLFEFLEVTDRAAGVSAPGRRTGKVNINTFWDQEILMALADPQKSNYFNNTDVQMIYANLMNGRSPNYLNFLGGTAPQPIGPTDRPFMGMAVGNIPVGDQFFPNGTGINDTVLRVANMGLVPPTTADPPPTAPPPNYPAPAQGRPDLPRLFDHPRMINPTTGALDPVLSHPAVRWELLNKVYNNLTTRSNVFGVWCTIGYFEVTNDQTRPVQLGAEIGKAAGTNVRHRFFGVVDRTQMVIARNLINSAPGAGGAEINPANTLLGPGQNWLELEMSPGGNQIATCAAATGPIIGNPPVPNPNPARSPISWNISVGSVLVLDRGTASEEWVQVANISSTNPTNPVVAQSANNPVWIQASFIRPHNPGFSITQPGNPGPQPPIDVRDYFHAPVVSVSVNLNN